MTHVTVTCQNKTETRREIQKSKMARTAMRLVSSESTTFTESDSKKYKLIYSVVRARETLKETGDSIRYRNKAFTTGLRGCVYPLPD